MGDFLEYRTQKQFEGLKEPYTPTTEEIRERFILGAMRRRDLEQEVADWDAWFASVKAEAWEKGYDACVIDSRKPVQDEATENPYRDGTWTKWDSPMFHEGRMWGRAEKEAEIEHRILKRKRLMEIPHAEEGDWLLTDSQAGDDED